MSANEPFFKTNPQSLSFLLEQINNRSLAIPDFQRNFVWDAAATQDLIASIGSRYPAGTLLFLDQQGASKAHFKPRQFEGAPELDGAEPQTLVLDGQQRLTALYQALYGVGDYVYYVDMKELLAEKDLEKALGHVTDKRAKKEIGDLDAQASALRMPLNVLMDSGFDEWLDEVIERREVSHPKLTTKAFKKELRAAYKAHLKPLQVYAFPVVDLPRTTKLEAVCKIFETLNRTGIKLTVFELLVARFWPQGISLRELWDKARSQYDILEDFEVDPYWLLQAICLRSGGASPSVQRQDVLALESDAINAHWDSIASNAANVLELLRDECGVLTYKWLPYSAVLVPLSAIWGKVEEAKGPAKGAARNKLKQYFWASVFSGAFDASPNSGAVRHYQELGKWLDGGAPPEVLSTLGVRFNADFLLEAKIGQRALYRGVMALTVMHGALDFHNFQPLTSERLTERKIDAHHVFPRKYLQLQGESGQALPSADLVLNRALIDKQTNRSIQDRAPSDYLKEIDGVLTGDLGTVLDSQLLPSDEDGGLWSDDYEEFLSERQTLIVAKLEAVTGQQILPSDSSS
ncbi:MAG TPA: DUF262 domain-containing protein [Solirubrobacterales bacterium]|nr:DUF262 domain-containing protein [Solirubrobacterales bacterium]